MQAQTGVAHFARRVVGRLGLLWVHGGNLC
jgi:hypothetical protein